MFILSSSEYVDGVKIDSENYKAPRLLFESYDEAKSYLLRKYNNLNFEKEINGQYDEALIATKKADGYLLAWRLIEYNVFKPINTSKLGDYPFKVEEIVQTLIESIKIDMKGHKAVIGISGGKDSTIAATLMQRALGKENVILVTMPNKDNLEGDEEKEIAEVQRYLDNKIFTVPIVDYVQAISKDLCRGANATKDYSLIPNNELSKNSLINLPARMRMLTLYAIAQSNNGWVINTCNLSEDMMGYSTLYGDFAGSYAPLKDFTVSELMCIGQYLGIPRKLLYKTPSDGLCGSSDEESMGLRYKDIDYFIRNGELTFEETLDPLYLNTHPIPTTVTSEMIIIDIVERFQKNRFKTLMLNIPGPSLIEERYPSIEDNNLNEEDYENSFRYYNNLIDLYDVNIRGEEL